MLNLTNLEPLTGRPLQWLGHGGDGGGSTGKDAWAAPELGIWRAQSFSGEQVFGGVVWEICDPKRRSAEELQEARLAVRLAGTLLEGAFGEWA